MKAVVGLVYALVGLGQAWAEPPSPIVAIALNCASCHAEIETTAPANIPSLKRLSPEQLRQALLAFKAGVKQGTIMPRLTKGYSDQELSALADYLGNS